MLSSILKNKIAVLLLPLLIWSCFIAVSAHGQAAGHKKQLRYNLLNARYYWQHDLYFEAAGYYSKAAELAPDDAGISYQLAECHRHLFNYKLAEKEYGQVYYSGAQNYPAALFYYALMQKINKKYADATKNFDAFIERAMQNKSPDFVEKDTLIKRARLEKAGCEFAFLQMSLPWREYNLLPLPSPVNSDFHDYAPVIFENDSSVLLTSGRENVNSKLTDSKLGESLSDIYRFGLDTSGWKAIEQDDHFDIINTQWSEGTGTFNKTRDKFYFTSCYEENSSCKIYLTTLQNGKWTKPVKLNAHINLPKSDSRQPALSANGDTLYFVSNRPGGFGLNDIWMSVSSGNENWGMAANMGSKINTPQQELSPFYDVVEKKLLFASDGHIGLGGLDIFMLQTPDSSVVNLGFPVNSDKDDCFFVMGNNTGYLSSNRNGHAGTFDIYSFKLKSSETVLALINKNPSDGKTNLAYLAFFNLEYLPEDEKLAVDRIVSRKEAGRIYKKELPLDKEDAFFYEHLSAEEKQRIERIVDKRMSQLTEADLSVLRGQDEFYYENLPAEEKDRVTRLAKAFLRSEQTNEDVVLNEQDGFFYRNLSYEDKKKLNRVIASRMEKETVALIDLATLTEEDRFYYEKLPAEEKERIHRMIAARKAQQQDGSDVLLNQEDFFNYTHLSEEEKKTVNRIIATHLNNETGNPDTTALKDQEHFTYQQLPVNEKNRLSIQTSGGRNSAKLNAEDRPLNNPEADPVSGPSNNFFMGNYNNVSISGRLMEVATKSPAAGIAVPLVDEKDNVIKTIITDENGSFKYTNLPMDENYKLLLETPSAKLIEPAKYYVENLQVVGYEEAPIAINLKNIYFDFDKYTLRAEAVDMLNKLADFYHRFPDIQIELYAYTDSIGSDTYNLALSKKRGQAVFDYLQSKGIPSGALVVNARGKSNPVISNTHSLGRQANRRVEFVIKGGPLLYNQNMKTYISPVRISLAHIAEETGMTVDELKNLNDLSSDFIEPYQPIKVKSLNK